MSDYLERTAAAAVVGRWMEPASKAWRALREGRQEADPLLTDASSSDDDDDGLIYPATAATRQRWTTKRSPSIRSEERRILTTGTDDGCRCWCRRRRKLRCCAPYTSTDDDDDDAERQRRNLPSPKSLFHLLLQWDNANKTSTNREAKEGRRPPKYWQERKAVCALSA